MARKTKKKPAKRAKRPRKSEAWDKEFGARLSRARGELSQEKMAEYLDVPVNTYQKYERGDRTFPKDLIPRVVIKTGHGPWLLLTGDPDNLCPAYRGWLQAAPAPPVERGPMPATERQRALG